MAAASLKQMARERTVKVGHFMVEFDSPGIGYLLKNAGCDFVHFDAEHSGFHYETIKSALRYFEAAGLPVIIRVPSKEYHHIARVMDMGTEGLMVPMVNDAAEIRAVLDCMKYVPEGKRGVALGIAHDHYADGPVMEKLAAANRRSTLFALIETAAGIENVDEIAAVDGVDCLWVGHFDLTCSLGIPGEFKHPKFRDSIARTYAACKKYNKSFGRLVPDVASGLEVFGQGCDFICYSGDVWVFQAALKAGVDGIRAGCRGNAGRAARSAPTRASRKTKKAR